MEAWRRDAEEMRGWVATLSDDDLAGLIKVPWGPGFPMWRLLFHLLSHSTQQRTEASVLLTGLGHSPGDFEFLNFISRTQTALRGGVCWVIPPARPRKKEMRRDSSWRVPSRTPRGRRFALPRRRRWGLSVRSFLVGLMCGEEGLAPDVYVCYEAMALMRQEPSTCTRVKVRMVSPLE